MLVVDVLSEWVVLSEHKYSAGHRGHHLIERKLNAVQPHDQHLLQILYNFDQFVTPMWLWRIWRNFHFITWPGGLWQGPNFVRWTRFWQKLPHSGYMWQITHSSRSPVTCDHDQILFRQEALWHVTDKLIEIPGPKWARSPSWNCLQRFFVWRFRTGSADRVCEKPGLWSMHLLVVDDTDTFSSFASHPLALLCTTCYAFICNYWRVRRRPL